MDSFPLDKLPEEILESVFSFTSSYKDYLNISLVCKKWNRIVQGLRQLDAKLFSECFINGKIAWNFVQFPSHLKTPQQRHSHSCCRVQDHLYVFGGLTDTCTSFNDLWTLDLNTKTWIRPTTDGAYPSPKACASLVAYNSWLILFGGYSHPHQHPLNQQVNFFDELHIYCTKTCTWRTKMYANEAPKLAGHTASLIDNDKMILFGGCNGSLSNKTNSVYCLCLSSFEWIKKDIQGMKPESRYGHSQVTIDDERILIVGGCGGPNHLYDDIWSLTLPKSTNTGYWQKIITRQAYNAPTQLNCISLVRCGDKLITFGKPKTQLNEVNGKRKCTCVASTPKAIKPAAEADVNAQKKALVPRTSSTSPNGNHKLLNKSERNTAKRLEVLQNIASRYFHSRFMKNGSENTRTNAVNQCIVHSRLMQVFVLNIQSLLNRQSNQLLEVTWLEPIFSSMNAPPNTILYSLTNGINEILLFGGMEIDSSLSNSQYSNNNNNNNNQGNDNHNEIVKHKVCSTLYIMKANNLF